MKISLKIVKGPEKGREFNITKPENILVGRSKEAQIMICSSDKYVSRNHCILEVVPPRCVLHHISTSNETKVNDISVSEVELNNNDIISVGFTSLKISLNKDIHSRSVKCRQCLADFTVPDYSNDSVLCDKCTSNIKPVSTSHVSHKNPVCDKCGKKLTAVDISEDYTYFCPGCLPPREYLKGDNIGKYELVRFLNQGGMGAVYLVYHESTSRLLVLKKIDGIVKNEILVKHFLREINVHRKLSHQNIIRYIDSGVNDALPYLVMEFANSGDLEGLLESSEGKIGVEQCVDYAIQSFKGLKYIHENNFIHRDIKPGNILLHKHNSETTIKLTDFGIAKSYNNNSGTILTKVGERKGSLLFMPPEQVVNTKDVSQSCDIYSLGVTIYYLLSARMPFSYPSYFEINQLKHKYTSNRKKLINELNKLGFRNNVLSLVLSQEVIPIEKRVNNLNPRLTKTINRLVQKDLKKRYQKIDDVLNDLI